ncbi:MAG: M28 family peptidase [Anaerolineales bacterium]|nr:M28 family peptidase [Anaerolineales bacterium]
MSELEGNFDTKHYAQSAHEHIAYLTQSIGGRGSCTPEEKEAAEYIAQQLRNLGALEVHFEPFHGAHSAYARYVIIFALALLSTAITLAWRHPATASLAAFLHGLGILGMIAESDFSPNWTHQLIPSRPSQNVLGVLSAQRKSSKRVVLTAHMDSHRTPIFNSNRFWQRVYNLGFKSLFGSLIAGSFIHLFIALRELFWLRGLLLIPSGILLVGILLFLHADLTPFSPGAYDNASGVASALALAERVAAHPLEMTDVTIAMLGCEENGAWGAYALYEAHSDEWRNAIVINLDQMAMGTIYIRAREGILVRYHPKPEMLALAHHVHEKMPYLGVFERVSQAFSDATLAYKNGISALSLGTTPTKPGATIHRHRMSDTIEHVELDALRATQRYVWGLLQAIDMGVGDDFGV